MKRLESGSVSIIGNDGRHKVILKAYISTFVCFSTKALHIELLSDLTIQIFLDALSRFVSRRGIPSDIYSDHEITFVGASNELKKLYSFLDENTDSIQNLFSVSNIEKEDQTRDNTIKFSVI